MKSEILNAIPRLSGKRVLVAGDVILDEYLIGSAARLSREAPVPVLEYRDRRLIPGGAANPAMNVAALGSIALQVGLIGDDLAGQELAAQLEAFGIDVGGLIVDASRCTTQKTRIVSRGRFPQQLARFDRVDRHPPDAKTEAAVIKRIQALASGADAILVSDYRSGMLSLAVVEALKTAAKRHKLLLVVDSQGNLDKYTGCAIIRANDRDTARYLNRPLQKESDFEAAAGNLLDALNAQGIVIGRGAEGVSLLECGGVYRHFLPVNPTEVFDVTGAGDTSTAVLALGLAAGLDLPQAALLANYAAGLVVQKFGNAAPSAGELREAVEKW